MENKTNCPKCSALIEWAVSDGVGNVLVCIDCGHTFSRDEVSIDAEYAQVDGEDEFNTEWNHPIKSDRNEIARLLPLLSYERSFADINGSVYIFKSEDTTIKVVTEEQAKEAAEHYKDAHVADLRKEVEELKKQISYLEKENSRFDKMRYDNDDFLEEPELDPDKKINCHTCKKELFSIHATATFYCSRECFDEDLPF